MGYYTEYSLYIEAKTDIDAKFIMHNLFEDEDYARMALEEDGSTGEACKWYDHEIDLISFSLKYPDVIFKLMGDGEESNDLWVKYFKNGKIQKCKGIINYEPFDESKLKENS
jgi:hypothetical protein